MMTKRTSLFHTKNKRRVLTCTNSLKSRDETLKYGPTYMFISLFLLSLTFLPNYSNKVKLCFKYLKRSMLLR